MSRPPFSRAPGLQMRKIAPRAPDRGIMVLEIEKIALPDLERRRRIRHDIPRPVEGEAVYPPKCTRSGGHAHKPLI